MYNNADHLNKSILKLCETEKTGFQIMSVNAEDYADGTLNAFFILLDLV